MFFFLYKLNTIGRGYYFRDVNMYLNKSSDFTIKASSFICEIISIKKELYSDLKRNYPDIIENITKVSNKNINHWRL